MKVLLVYPEFPETYWSFRHALRFIGKQESPRAVGGYEPVPLLWHEGRNVLGA